MLQTRNQLNGTCEGLYLQFDASVQFAKSDEYVMSKLTWPVWIAVVSSVAAAIAAIVIVGVVVYRFQHMDMLPPVETGEDGGLLNELDGLSSPKSSASPGSTSLASGKGLLSTALRQRAAPDVTQLEARGSCTTL